MKKLIAAGLVTASALGFAGACSVPEDPPKGNDKGVSQGVGAKDATKDVKLSAVNWEGYGAVTVRATVTNHSEKTSDYSIEANVYLDGTQVGTVNGFVSRVAPQGKAHTTLYGDVSDAGNPPYTVKLTLVERTASY